MLGGSSIFWSCLHGWITAMDTHEQLPDRFAFFIAQAHAMGVARLKQAGVAVESVEAALAVERQRWAWRPSHA